MRRLPSSPSVPFGALALVLASCGRTPEPPEAAHPAVHAQPLDLLLDDRIAHLMGGCAKNEPFLEDTSDLIPVLVANLSEGQPDPSRAALEELALYGERALPALQREFEENCSSQYLAPRVQNVIEALGAMRTDASRELILRGLTHPQETVRKAAARALVPHARPTDYDLVMDALAVGGPDSRGDLAAALVAADRERVERALAGWIEGGGANPLVETLVVPLCTTRDPEVLAAWRALYPRTQGKVRVFLMAALAKSPDEALLAELRTTLFDPSKPVQRLLTAQALSAVGLVDELAPLLTRHDPDPGMRKYAAEALAAVELDAHRTGVLQGALSDELPEIRDIALTTLCAHGEAGALDTALEYLRGSRVEFDAGQKALRLPTLGDPALARRVFETLTALQRGDLGQGLVDDRMIVRAIGQLPLAEAAAYVMDLAQHATGTIQGLRAFRWYAQAAGNAGPDGLARLRELWRTEDDPAHRMDYVMAGSFEKSDATRAFLVAALDDPRATPAEMLYAADRLARIGPSEFAAPILKRAALKVNDRAVRPAFNCLLWTWYGRKGAAR